MTVRSARYLANEFVILALLLATVALIDFAYQADILSKGLALGCTALFMLASVIVFVGFAIDLFVAVTGARKLEAVDG